MKFLATILTFIGYVLVYAGVANGGKFATQPWMGILNDAYADTNPNVGNTGGSTGAPSTQNRKNPSISGGGRQSQSAADKQTSHSGDSLPLQILKFAWGGIGGGLIP